MVIGVPKEVKTDEYRVGATPSNVKLLVNGGHEVFVQSSAGKGSGFLDSEYLEAGAKIVSSAKELYENSTLIVKVKEPQPSEYELLNEKHTLFCYLHLAPLPELVSLLMQKKVCAIAYETVAVDNRLPLLKPMSEVAGRMSPIVAAHYLSRYKGGEGVLISGSDGVDPAKVLIIGAGNAGFNAAQIASGMGADVTVINRSMSKLEKLKESLLNVKTSTFTPDSLAKMIGGFDIVISTVLIHGGAATPKLITRDMLKSMRDGSVLVDITIDQGGISETSRPTTHSDPIFIQEGVIHYCVANMPGAYPKTSTIALTNATIGYVKKLSDNGCINAIKDDPSLAAGVNVFEGVLTNEAVAEVQGVNFQAIDFLLGE